MIDQSSLDITTDVFRSHMSAMKLVSGEWKGPCPQCKGTNRFIIFPRDHKKHGGNGGAFFCRQCQPQMGDCIEAMQFLNTGMTKSVAMIELELSVAMPGGGSGKRVDLAKAPPDSLDTIPLWVV